MSRRAATESATGGINSAAPARSSNRGAATLTASVRPRAATATLTGELERRMQALLDAINPGRPLDPE